MLKYFSVIIYFTIDLVPNILLKTNFLNPYGVKINYPNHIISFNLYQNFTAFIKITAKRRPINYKIIAAIKTVLPPNILIKIYIIYKNLLTKNKNGSKYNYIF